MQLTSSPRSARPTGRPTPASPSKLEGDVDANENALELNEAYLEARELMRMREGRARGGPREREHSCDQMVSRQAPLLAYPFGPRREGQESGRVRRSASGAVWT